jgi:hypothetical protein
MKYAFLPAQCLKQKMALTENDTTVIRDSVCFAYVQLTWQCWLHFTDPLLSMPVNLQTLVMSAALSRWQWQLSQTWMKLILANQFQDSWLERAHSSTSTAEQAASHAYASSVGFTSPLLEGWTVDFSSKFLLNHDGLSFFISMIRLPWN